MNLVHPFYPFKRIRQARGAGRSLPGRRKSGALIGPARSDSPVRVLHLSILRAVRRPAPALYAPPSPSRHETLSA
jgi:hypothetical protein